MDGVKRFVKTETFSRNRILFCAFVARITLVLYAHIHDYMFKVNFTDIDYSVFSDAAKHVSNGGSPFDRDTYRYTPALAWILLPVVQFPDFGKILFCIFDIIVAVLYFKIMDYELLKNPSKNSDDIKNRQTFNVAVFWLANPLTAIISARGNAESIVSAIVLLNLLLLQRGYYKTSALVHGALAIQFKIYPLIYLPSVYLYLSDFHQNRSLQSLIFNRRGIIYGLITIFSFGLVVLGFYQIYGQIFLDEYLIYHVKRRDIKHNFSAYFFILYLFENNELMSKIIGFLAFVPQVAVIFIYAFRYFEDLPFCWLMTTFAFVAFNKVCTSQYFVWYLVLLPLCLTSIQLPNHRALLLTLSWIASQALWLLFAYLFEFRGWNTFVQMFLASLVFLLVNCWILYEFGKSYRNSEAQKQNEQKKND
ncbi:unnamed protein product [Caenorhabditis angaria]|uniref:GPI alpha-1,4-mannosyltransferase I, catalytic subunit n=1 Tax=Caenorhabditis angaria TaxID=860376 RepID=A0A9P1ICP9_9PELO|nr:unnamed protein product [Caenorhabditis angaria]